jgi:hypothetical protein
VARSVEEGPAPTERMLVPMSAPTPSRSTLPRGHRRRIALALACLGAAVAVTACSSGVVTDVAARDPLGNQAGRGAGGGGGVGNGGGYGGGNGGGVGNGGGPAGGEEWGTGEGDVAPRIAALPVTTLTAEEIEGLRWMREEEKLAHDVYVALGETWGLRAFENIAAAETTHGEAIKTLLDRHGIADPAAGQPAGAFTDPELQALYGDLVARGRTSLVDALTVGALIEEMDISDLRERASDTQDIALVYEDLERGSENHLRAFVRNLERRGGTYTPTHISVDEFESIPRSSNGQGHTG